MTKGIDVYGPYHQFVKTLPCILAPDPKHLCQAVDDRRKIEGHHLKHAGSGGPDYGNEVPVCPAAHDEIHWSPEKFEQRHGVNLAALALGVKLLWDRHHGVVYLNLLDAHDRVHRAVGPWVAACGAAGWMRTTDRSVTCSRCDALDRF